MSKITMPDGYPEWGTIGTINIGDSGSINSVVNVNEVPIKGELVEIKMNVRDEEVVSSLSDAEWRQYIKKTMAERLAEKLMKDHIEYTTMVDHLTGERTVYARCFLAPNDHVQLIRMKRMQDGQRRN